MGCGRLKADAPILFYDMYIPDTGRRNNMAIVAAYMVPHPPMIIPQIGRGSEGQITETIRAYEQAAEEIAALQPETINKYKGFR